MLSIIVPCFNSEKTLADTLQSIVVQSFQNWEAIIINDGSPDNLENIALEFVKSDQRFKYFKKENGGLASARNFGIKKSKGNYILPLDSDNKIRPNFVETALRIFDQNTSLGVVYGDANYFGIEEGLWKVGPFDKYRLLKHNYIDACSLIKKEIFDNVGLYDQNLPHQGHEDWDLWLRIVASKHTFYYLEEVTFDYRVSNNSMIKGFNEKMLKENIKYIKLKHFDLYEDSFAELYNKYQNLKVKIENKSNFWSLVKKRLEF